MKTKSIFSLAVLSFVFVPSAAFCLQPALLPSPVNIVAEEPEDAKDSAYAEATRAINENRWTDAESLFAKIAAQKGDRADAALYWKAYAQNKEGQLGRALETCAELGHSYAKSLWTGECDALRIEIRGRSGQPVSPQSTSDDELKLLALNTEMQQNAGRALPTIRQILDGNGSERLKERALFVLASSDSPDAQKLIGEIARGQSNPQLQVRAVRMYAAIRGKQSADTLADVYQHTANEAVKRAILQSYMATGTPDKLIEAIHGEQNPVLTKTAVQSLGAMSADDALLQIYRESKDAQIKSAVIGSLVASGTKGAAALSEIAKSEQNPELRSKAIRNLGIAGGSSATPALLATYQSNTDTSSKNAALEALFLANDAHNLVALARTEKNPELKRTIVSKLSIMQNKEATDYMMELLNK